MLDAILARTIAFVESFAAAQVYGSESRPVAGATARRGLKVGAGRSGGFAEHCSAPAKPVGYAEPTVGGAAIPLVRFRRPATGRCLMGSRPSGSLAAGPRQAAG
jgi:hypothetical protein